MSQAILSPRQAQELVDELARVGDIAGVRELARRLGLTKNQVLRVLKTRETFGYVQQADSRSYRLGLNFFELRQQGLGETDLLHIAPPLMDELRDATGETVDSFVRDGLEAIRVARWESRALFRMSAAVGRRFALHAGACLKASLAFQPDERIATFLGRGELPAYTVPTVTERDALLARPRESRAWGYAIGDEDLDIHAFPIAVPRFARNNQVNAAMRVAGPVQRFGPNARCRVLKQLTATRARVSTLLGAVRLPRAGIAAALPALEQALG